MNFTARLKKEWSKTKQAKAALPPDTELDVDLYPRAENDLATWTATILGPPDSPYEDHSFKLRLTVPNRYPLMPPKANFLTKVCHPNVHFKTGEICLDVLKDQWTPSYTLESVCRTIIQLLSHPAADSPLNCDCGNMIRAGDMAAYHAVARMYTLDFAQPTRMFFEKRRRLQAERQQRMAARLAARLEQNSSPPADQAEPSDFESSPSSASSETADAEAKHEEEVPSSQSSISPVSLTALSPESSAASSPDPIF